MTNVLNRTHFDSAQECFGVPPAAGDSEIFEFCIEGLGDLLSTTTTALATEAGGSAAGGSAAGGSAAGFFFGATRRLTRAFLGFLVGVMAGSDGGLVARFVLREDISN